MLTFLNSPFTIGKLHFPNRLIQGPLAGFSCAAFRELFSYYQAPAFCVTEMISAHDVVYKPTQPRRYMYRGLKEKRLCYQISGIEPAILAQAARHLETLGADMIDINCGCPKLKIRKKGAGSALLDKPSLLLNIVAAVRNVITCPLTVKLRIQQSENDLILAKQLEDAGVDALIVHGRRWVDDYDVICDLATIRRIKQAVTIPVIANGDIADTLSLEQTLKETGCDSYMISRAGTGKPWLYQSLLTNQPHGINYSEQVQLFIQHLEALAQLEDDYKAILQSKSLVRYYFKTQLSPHFLQKFYRLDSITAIRTFLTHHLIDEGKDSGGAYNLGCIQFS